MIEGNENLKRWPTYTEFCNEISKYIKNPLNRLLFNFGTFQYGLGNTQFGQLIQASAVGLEESKINLFDLWR